MLLISVFLILPANVALALPIQINPNLRDIKPNLPDIFISAHEVIKAVPIYRVFQTQNGQHFYTVNVDQYNDWKSKWWINDDGCAGYISPVPLPYTVPMWNMVKHGEQYFATSQAARDDVIGKYGYSDYGIMGYVVSLNDTAHGNSQMYQWYKGNSSSLWNADHYYNWAVGYISSYTYEGPQFRHWSDASVLQEVNLLSPNGGETLTGGSKVDISWQTLIPGGNISLYYTLNPSEGWSVIAENLENTGSYSWTVPNSATSKAIVEARWTYAGIDANCYDQSDKYFSIKTSSGTQINWVLTLKPIAFDLLLAPSAPTNLTAGSDMLQKQPVLYWQDNASNETGYVIERKADEGNYAKLVQVPANQTKYMDNSAVADITYFYRVKAVNGTKSSAYSNETACSVYTIPKINLPTPGSDTDNPPAGASQVSMLFTLGQNSYSVNGVTKTMDVSPVSIGGRTLLPIRYAADPLGAETVWDGNESKVSVTLGATKLILWIGSNTAVLNGQNILIDPNNPGVKPLIINGRTMLPMRFVTEKLGCGVEWIPAYNQIKVIYPSTYLDPQPEPPGEIKK